MIEIETPDGMLRWAPGRRVRGDQVALYALRVPRNGNFGLMPDPLPFDQAHTRKDSFLHLVATIWPTHKIVTDNVPDEKWSPTCVY